MKWIFLHGSGEVTAEVRVRILGGHYGRGFVAFRETWGEVWEGLGIGIEEIGGRGSARTGGIGMCRCSNAGWAVFSCVCFVLHLFFIC